MKLQTHVEIFVPKPREEVFDFCVRDDIFERVLRPLGPIPGVVRTEREGDGPTVTGTRRRLTMTDKTIVGEEVLLLDRPREHRYRWLSPPAPPLSFLVKGGEGSWTFHAEGPGTRLRWDYEFELTSPLAYPATALFAVLFRRWMSQGLRLVRDELGA